MRVLLVFAAAVSGALSLIMAAYLRSHRGHAGFAQWTAGTALVSASLVFSALRGLVPALISILGVNVSFLAMAPFFLDGTRRFLGLRPLRRRWYALALVPFGACLYFFVAHDDIAARTAILMAAAAVPLAAAAGLLVRHRPTEPALLHDGLAAQFALTAVLLLSRAVWVLGRAGFTLWTESPMQYAFFTATAVLHLGITVTFVLLTADRAVAGLSRARAELVARVDQLQLALGEVRTLEGLLPICAACKRIRDENGDWIQMEVFVRDRTRADFSHGLCPSCLPKYFPPSGP
ncbi:MAG: hypothetical protein PHQ91_13150 [Thermoanaerobaculaceae bacterium]|nr:hypothetical protein [Thermoanaerobaculaceae bacterium]